MPDEKKYKIINDFRTLFLVDKTYTTDEIINLLVNEKFIQEIRTEKQYFLGSVRLYQAILSQHWYDNNTRYDESKIRIYNDIFQQLLSEGIIQEIEVEFIVTNPKDTKCQIAG